MISIKPDKYTHPDKSVVFTAAIILNKLRAERIVGFNLLLGVVKEYTGVDYVLFTPAIHLIYLLGLVEYHPKTDSFEYIGR